MTEHLFPRGNKSHRSKRAPALFRCRNGFRRNHGTAEPHKRFRNDPLQNAPDRVCRFVIAPQVEPEKSAVREEVFRFPPEQFDGSDDLTGVYKTSGVLANDTSFGVGYAPYSITDTLVLKTEEMINSPAFKKILPETGQDVKVMGSRVDNKLTMTVACAMVDKYVPDKGHYASAIEDLYNRVQQNALDIIDKSGEDIDFKLEINTGDNYDNGVYYLTVTGLSQEMGDDGSVGRGNRCNGLITPYRPMSMEATSGKNPITHIGKIYNVMSKLIADDIAAKVSPEVEVKVRILSQIGKPVSQPLNCSVQLVSEEVNEGKLNQWKSEAESIAYDWLDNVDKVTELIINGKVRTF